MSENSMLYTVQSGDTIAKIAAAQGVSTNELIAANNLENPDLIKPGQLLVIPTPVTACVDIQFLDKLGNAISGMDCFILCAGQETLHKTDENGNIPTITAKKPGDPIKIAVKKMEGGKKPIGIIHSSVAPKFVQVISPAVKVEITTQQHKGTAGNADAGRPKAQGPEQGKPSVTTARDQYGAPVAIVAGGAVLEKSGMQWCGRYPQSKRIEDLKQPFQGKLKLFLDALAKADINVTINTTLRPPQRSYLMYYAGEIYHGRLAPDKVPPFIPRNGDAPVNIDWAHRGDDGKADLVAARKAATIMFTKYNARYAIGKPYKSNHNGGEAIDMALNPGWGIGKTIVTNDGKKIDIKSKRDLLNVGASYGVFHWNYSGEKRTKNDPPHWSKTGN